MPDKIELSLDQLKDTNNRLDRRCQQLESVVAKNKYYIQGFADGFTRGKEHSQKIYEKKLAEYKASTRKIIRELREGIEKQADDFFDTVPCKTPKIQRRKNNTISSLPNQCRLPTGFLDKSKKELFDGDMVIFENNKFEISMNLFLGQWVITGDTGEVALYKVYTEVEKLGEDDE